MTIPLPRQAGPFTWDFNVTPRESRTDTVTGLVSGKATTYASAEQFFLAHVVHTLAVWYARFEQSADVSLLSAGERKQGYYFKFLAGGLLRGALKDRGEYFARALGAGGGPAWMTQDEVRDLEEMNPFGGEAAELPPLLGRPAEPATP